RGVGVRGAGGDRTRGRPPAARGGRPPVPGRSVDVVGQREGIAVLAVPGDRQLRLAAQVLQAPGAHAGHDLDPRGDRLLVLRPEVPENARALVTADRALEALEAEDGGGVRLVRDEVDHRALAVDVAAVRVAHLGASHTPAGLVETVARG